MNVDTPRTRACIVKALRYTIASCTVLILILPLYVDKSVIYPLLFSKTVFFHILAEVSIAAYIILHAIETKSRFVWRHSLIVASGIFVLLMLLTSATGVDPLRSLWSTPQWMSGVVTYAHFFLWFLILSNTFKRWSEWRCFLWTSLLVCVVVVLYGFGEKVNVLDLYRGSRISATFGNPLYLASYITLHIYIAYILFLKSKSVFERIILTFFSLLFIIGIILTGSRSALITLGVSLFGIYISLFLIIRARKIRFMGIIGGAAFCVFGIALLGWLYSSQGHQWTERNLDWNIRRSIYHTIDDPERLGLWDIAIRGFYERPLLGWGPNNYSYIFSTSVKPQDYGTLFPSTWYDQAHNQVLNRLTEMGILGLLSYLSLWVVVWFQLVRKVIQERDRIERLISILLALFFLSYFLQTLTAFDTVASLIMLYFGFGFAYFLTHKEGRVEERENTPRTIPLPIIVIPTLAILMVTLTFFSIVPYVKARAAKKAIDMAVTDFDRGLAYFQAALSGLSFTHDDVRVKLARAALLYHDRLRAPTNQKREFLMLAISEMEKSVERHPALLEYGIPLLQLYRLYTEEYSDVFLSRAENLATRLREQYPRRRDILFETAFIAKLKGDYKGARQKAYALVDLDPSRGDSYWVAAQIAAEGGDFSEIFTLLDSAFANGYDIYNEGKLFYVLAAKADREHAQHLLSYVEDGLKRHPNTMDFVGARAIILSRLGKSRLTKDDIEWLRRRDNEFANATEILIKNKPSQ